MSQKVTESSFVPQFPPVIGLPILLTIKSYFYGNPISLLLLPNITKVEAHFIETIDEKSLCLPLKN